MIASTKPITATTSRPNNKARNPSRGRLIPASRVRSVITEPTRKYASGAPMRTKINPPIAPAVAPNFAPSPIPTMFCWLDRRRAHHREEELSLDTNGYSESWQLLGIIFPARFQQSLRNLIFQPSLKLSSVKKIDEHLFIRALQVCSYMPASNKAQLLLKHPC